jgi:glycosyltransferase involved in cell wall biosynthesis
MRARFTKETRLMQPDQPLRATLSEEAAARRDGPPKVLFLLSHSGNGGAQELWMNLAEAFRSRGCRVQLAALYKPEDEEAMPAIGSLDWIYVNERRTSAARMLPLLMRFLRLHDPDLVFTALPAAGVLTPVAALAAGCKARVVVSHHTPVDTYAPMLNRLDALTGRLAKVGAVVSVSRAVSDSLERRPAAYRSKTSVIRNSLPPALEFRLAELAARRGVRSPGRKLMAIGRLAPQKNYPVLLRAMTRVEDAQLTIVGAGPDEQALKGLAQDLRVTDRVRFAGQKSRLDALEMLADSDVFLQPSLFEGHSLALIEASALGVPLIVSRVPAQVEGVTTSDGAVCGVVVEPQDDEALAAEIRRMLDDDGHRAEWTRRSAALGASTTFARTVAAYEALVGKLTPVPG